MPRDWSWTEHAVCKGAPVDWFFPEAGGRAAAHVIDLCQSCPVSDECLAASLSPFEHGVWGGKGERARRRHRERRR